MGIGNANLGAARGKIEIDLSDLDNIRVTTRAVARDAEQSLGRMNRAVERTETGWARLHSGIKSIRGELTVIGAAGGLLTGLGLRAASNFEQARIQVTGMAGGIAEGVEMLEELRDLSNRMRVPLNDVMEGFRTLGPLIDNDVQKFQRLLDLSRRLAVRNPREGISGAAFGIGEALSSGGTDLVSLVERFNVPRTQLREAIALTGDFADGLDMVLTRMGITSQVADEMGDSAANSLRLATDAANQLLAVGFAPLLEALTPLLQRSAEWLNTQLQTKPEIATFGAGLAAIAAMAAPSLLVLNQMVEAAIKLRNLGVLGAAGRAGLVGVGAAVGAGLAVPGINAIGRADAANTGNTVLRDFTLQQAGTELTNMLRQWRSDWAIQILDATQFTANAFYNAIDAIGQFVSFLGRITLQSRLVEAGAGARGMAERGRATSSEMASNARAQMLQAGVQLSQVAPADVNAASAATPTIDSTREAQIQFSQDMERLETETAQQRLRITQQYAQQRAETIANYERSIARESEDFARQRARAVAEHENQIARVRSAGAERDARMVQELGARLADLRSDDARRHADALEDHNRRRAEQQSAYDERITNLREDGLSAVAKVEADARRDQERAARQHRDTILGAAANLDARAVAQEMRRWQTEQSDRERTQTAAIAEARAGLGERLEQERVAHEERLQQDQEQFDRRRARELRDLQLRIADEQAAHAQRLEEARAADAERIEDMQQAFEDQTRVEDEDRAIRLGRQAADHRAQLTAMQTAHGNQMTELNRAHGERLAALEDAHADELEELGKFNQSWKNIQDAREQQALERWDDWWKSFNERFPAPLTGPLPPPTDFHDPATPIFGEGNKSIVIQEGAIRIELPPNVNAQQTVDLLHEQLIQLLEEASD